MSRVIHYIDRVLRHSKTESIEKPLVVYRVHKAEITYSWKSRETHITLYYNLYDDIDEAQKAAQNMLSLFREWIASPCIEAKTKLQLISLLGDIEIETLEISLKCKERKLVTLEGE